MSNIVGQVFCRVMTPKSWIGARAKSRAVEPTEAPGLCTFAIYVHGGVMGCGRSNWQVVEVVLRLTYRGDRTPTRRG